MSILCINFNMSFMCSIFPPCVQYVVHVHTKYIVWSLTKYSLKSILFPTLCRVYKYSVFPKVRYCIFILRKGIISYTWVVECFRTYTQNIHISIPALELAHYYLSCWEITVLFLFNFIWTGFSNRSTLFTYRYQFKIR